jgi:hypothetical protein
MNMKAAAEDNIPDLNVTEGEVKWWYRIMMGKPYNLSNKSYLTEE